MQLIFSPNGKVLATADNDGTARLWNVATQRQIGAPIRLSGGVGFKNVALQPRRQGPRHGGLRRHRPAVECRDPPTRSASPIVVSKRRVVGVAFSPGGRTLATASWDGIVAAVE